MSYWQFRLGEGEIRRYCNLRGRKIELLRRIYFESYQNFQNFHSSFRWEVSLRFYEQIPCYWRHCRRSLNCSSCAGEVKVVAAA